MSYVNTDMIVQAKSGTGKTCVFAIAALELVVGMFSERGDAVSSKNPIPFVVILAPTREIAVQIHSVILRMCEPIPAVKSCLLIGGLSTREDAEKLKQGCHIVIGTPGRVHALIVDGVLNTEAVRLFILDEADQLLGEGFDAQITSIFECLPQRKQILALSATFYEELRARIREFMSNPKEVLLDPDAPSLEGVKQYLHVVARKKQEYEMFDEKVQKLEEILSSLQFHQCVIFCNNRANAQEVSSRLNSKGWPSSFIAGEQRQQDRMDAMKKLREFKIRVLISTDLTARGVDIERINLVINMDVPMHAETYLHRIGRTGRFGTYGVAISLANPREEVILKRIVQQYQSRIDTLPTTIPAELYQYDLSEEDQRRRDALERKREEARKRRKLVAETTDSVEGSDDSDASTEATTALPRPASVHERIAPAAYYERVREEQSRDNHLIAGERTSFSSYRVPHYLSDSSSAWSSCRSFLPVYELPLAPLPPYFVHAYHAAAAAAEGYPMCPLCLEETRQESTQ